MSTFKRSGTISPPGLVVLGPSLQLVAFNAEAIRILAYPDKPDVKNLQRTLSEKLPFVMKKGASGSIAGQVTQIACGRRRYVCRQYSLDRTEGTQSATVVVLLERVSSAEFALHLFSQQFNLTARENEALGFLLQGLTSKEIASRMSISPSTLKTFFRLVMVKAGVSSRASLVSMIAGMGSMSSSLSSRDAAQIPLTTVSSL